MNKEEYREYKTCKNCVFWNRIDKTMRGNCVRYPPTVSSSIVDYDHWCGEHKKG